MPDDPVKRLKKYLEETEPPKCDEWLSGPLADLSTVLKKTCGASVEKASDLLRLDLALLNPGVQLQKTTEPSRQREFENTFQLLGRFWGAFLASCSLDKAGNPKAKGWTQPDVEVLLSLTVRAVYHEEYRERVAEFFVRRLLPAERVPAPFRRLVAEQFILLWWAFPIDWFNELAAITSLEKILAWTPLYEMARVANRHIQVLGRIEKDIEKDIENDRRIVSFHSTKGGSGKTTFAWAFASACSRDGKKVALVDLDLVNPCVLNAHLSAELPRQTLVTPVERILLGDIAEKALDNACLTLTRRGDADILLLSAAGTLRSRDSLYRDLAEQLTSEILSEPGWQRVVSHFKVLFDWLFEKKHCTCVVLDNSPGLDGFPLAVSAITTGYHGLPVLVCTLDRTDLGALPARFFRFSRLWNRVFMVMNKVHTDALAEGLFHDDQLDTDKVCKLSWAEGLRPGVLFARNTHVLPIPARDENSNRLVDEIGVIIDSERTLKIYKDWLDSTWAAFVPGVSSHLYADPVKSKDADGQEDYWRREVDRVTQHIKRALAGTQ